MADSVEEIKKAQKKYLMVLGALCVFTVITVLVATVPELDFGEHGFDRADMILGLAIATVKASLVGAIFMHLNHEKKMIYWIFFGSFVFAVFLMWLTGWAFTDPIRYGEGWEMEAKSGFYNPENVPSVIEQQKEK